VPDRVRLLLASTSALPSEVSVYPFPEPTQRLKLTHHLQRELEAASKSDDVVVEVMVVVVAASADVMTLTAIVVEVVAAAAVGTIAVTTVRVVVVAIERTVVTTVATVTIVEAGVMTAVTTDANVTILTVAALTDTPDATTVKAAGVRVVGVTQVAVVVRSVVLQAMNVIVAMSEELTVRVLGPVIPLRPDMARLDPDLKAAKPTEVRPNCNKHFDNGLTSTANAPSRELSVRDGIS
jgi:hypothetical protein